MVSGTAWVIARRPDRFHIKEATRMWEKGQYGTHGRHRARRRHCRHLDCAASRQAGLERRADRSRRRGRADLLWQCRRDRGQYGVSAGVSVRSRRAGTHRAQARERGQLSSLVPAADRALAAGVPRGVAAAAAGRERAADPPAVCARGGRARGADGGVRRRALPAQDRLAESLSQRAQPSPRSSRNSNLAAAIRPAAASAGHRGRAGARAVAQSGVRACGVLAAGREREQSARRDARLCRALCRAGRRHAHRRRALAASRGQSLAGGNQRRRDRCARGRGRARAVGGRSA